MENTNEIRHPLPPFTRESAIEKVRLAEDGWNGRNPEKVSMAYSKDTHWRNRAEFITSRDEAKAFLERKWAKELEYRLIKSCGRIRIIAFQCGMPMNGTMILETGFAHMAMKTGNLMPRV